MQERLVDAPRVAHRPGHRKRLLQEHPSLLATIDSHIGSAEMGQRMPEPERGANCPRERQRAFLECDGLLQIALPLESIAQLRERKGLANTVSDTPCELDR